jgi:hypothetical protein
MKFRMILAFVVLATSIAFGANLSRNDPRYGDGSDGSGGGQGAGGGA